jgi:1-acyl-sn-glycerol-3-phosphate acyltransferase
MRFFSSIAAWFLAGIATFAFGVPATFAAFIPPRGDWYTPFARTWARTVLAIGQIPLVSVGQSRIDARGSYVFLVNHESALDILCLLAVLPNQVRFLAKRSLFRIPVLGWSMAAAGFVPIDRHNRAKAMGSFEKAVRRLRRGRSLILFPEETRSRDGDLLPFKRGGFLLALRAGLPIVPVGIWGTRGILPKGALVFRPGRVAVAVGTPMDLTGLGVRDREDLTRRVRDRIEGLRGEAREALEERKQAS